MISVITPTYNRPEYLRQTIDSFLKQDYEDKEMIIVNDGGKSIKNISSEYADNFKLHWFDYKENIGCPAILNFAIKQSKGDLICIIADDDLLCTPDSLSQRADAFEKDTEVVYSGFHKIDASGAITGTYIGEQVDKDRIWRQDYINIQSMMWKREVHDKIGYFSEDLLNNEDWEWKIKCLMECNVKMIPCPTVMSRYHGKNKSCMDKELSNKCAGLLMERMKKRYGK